jgi:hypothetical protein
MLDRRAAQTYSQTGDPRKGSADDAPDLPPPGSGSQPTDLLAAFGQSCLSTSLSWSASCWPAALPPFGELNQSARRPLP